MSTMSYAALFDPGILRSSLLPSLQVHAALAVPTYILGRSFGVVESKDILWSSGQIINAWWQAVGRQVVYGGIPFAIALRDIGRPGRLLLTGITVWGARLLYRVVTRRVKRGADDPRYDTVKENGWTRAALTMFLPEAIIQSFISLGYTFPFTAPLAPILAIKPEWRTGAEALAIGIWSAGMTLEVLADWQLARHKKNGERGLCREGVFSVVRHPNYLGDQLTHIAYPLLLLSANLFNPYATLGPIANWFFLRHVGGDKENEASQEERYRDSDPEKMLDLIESREEKNAFWPSLSEVANRWVWVVAGAGVAGVYFERMARPLL